MKYVHPLVLCFLVLSISNLSGCAQFTTRSSASVPLSSVIDTVKDSRQTGEKSPLVFPASVAVMFIPGNTRGVPETELRQAENKLKEQLLANPKYIRSVAIVSADDIKAKLSLAQIRAMYDTDIAVILSYKQDQSGMQNGPGGLVDATLVGAFLVPSVETKTSTIVDGRIIHIPSNAVIFRASGSDVRSVLATTYGSQGALVEQSGSSILAATYDFGKAVTKTMGKFDHFDFSQAVSMRVITDDSTGSVANESSGANWNKVDKFKSSGGGSFDVFSLSAILALAWVTRARISV